MHPFRFSAPQGALDDLKDRLGRARWPEGEPTSGWEEGVPQASLRRLVDCWQDDYDWRRCEAALDRFEHFRTEIDGLGIHFIHALSRHPDALPIILTHGWPGSVLEFLQVIEPLVDPPAHGGTADDAFHVVVPSLPGYGFSDKPTAPGWNVDRIARAWARLMQRLGHHRYVAQGGDWGAFVTTRMAQQRPSGLAAIHLNMPQVIPDPLPAELTPEQRHAVEAAERFATEGSGYFSIQSTRPQTIGYALVDSPVGQAAWIYDKFQQWTDNRGAPEDALSRDQMLDMISLYWLTGTAASSARLYRESRKVGFESKPEVVMLPMGCSVFPHEIVPSPRSWADAVYPNLIYWREVERGGHFAAYEQPILFVRELRAFAAALRRSRI